MIFWIQLECFRFDRDVLTVRLRLEADLSGYQRKNREVASEAGVRAGMDFRAPLTDNDRARIYKRTVSAFDAQILRLTVATVG